jgi:hypothetical protein
MLLLLNPAAANKQAVMSRDNAVAVCNIKSTDLFRQNTTTYTIINLVVWHTGMLMIVYPSMAY